MEDASPSKQTQQIQVILLPSRKALLMSESDFYDDEKHIEHSHNEAAACEYGAEEHYSADEHDSADEHSTEQSANLSAGTDEKGVEEIRGPILSLEDEKLLLIFGFFGGYSLPRLRRVCREWARLLDDRLLWRNVCAHHWTSQKMMWLEKVVSSSFGNSWQRVFREKPHVRFDGYYVLKTSFYQKAASLFLERQSGLQEVAYYRYLEFLSTDRLLFALLSDLPGKKKLSYNDKHLCPGTYRVRENRLVLMLPTAHLFCSMLLEFNSYRGGLHNRMSVLRHTGGDDKSIVFPVPERDFVFVRTET